MSKKWWVVTSLILIMLGFLFINRKENINLVNPKIDSVPTSIPSPTPKAFKFDSSTDLKMELESVNPQVLESDFERREDPVDLRESPVDSRE